MLEISCFFDAHFHLFECLKIENAFELLGGFPEYCGCSCAHSVEEWQSQENALEILENKNSAGKIAGNSVENTGNPGKFSEKKSAGKKIHILKSFGLHPQNPLVENAEFLESLLKSNALDAVGEAGFDLFTEEFRSNLDRQKKAWHIQAELAAKYGKPLVVHCRKGMQQLFQDAKILSKIPAVLFHSFPGPFEEARSVLRILPDACFSYGKQILNGNKKVLSCLENLPLKNILLETDAPFQHLKNERFTSCVEIKRVYEAAFKVRKDLSPEIIENNFLKTFRI